MPPQFVTPLIVATALFMETLDGTVLATALPAMAADLHEDPVALKLALTSYLLALAVFIPLSGWAADKFGARRVFRAAMTVFTLGSICCGLSSSLAGVVLSRVVQGMGGAMMTPVGRLVILRSAPRAELVRALAWLTIPALVGPMMGPPLGGFIATYFHWRYIFWINAPIGALGVLLAERFIPDLSEPDPGPLDSLGAALSGGGLACLVFGFSIVGRGFLPTPAVAALIAAGALALLAYVRHARRTEAPILDLSLLQVPTYRAAVCGGLLFRIGVGATPFLLPLLLQAGFHLSAFQSGSLTFVAAAGAMAMKTAAQPILKLFSFRRVLLVNAAIASTFLIVNAWFTPATPHWIVMGVLLAGGFFRSLEFTALNALAFADIESRDMSRAASFSAVAQQLSASLGVAIAAAALEVSRAQRGGGVLLTEDFAPAFFLIAGVSTLSIAFFWPLAPTAGDELAGRSHPAPTRIDTLS
ncbi:MAG TPA: MDR family MFS transporter [Methylocystis sp.]|nr:MDR family MFS transporter [Methylocystis sp.]